MISSVADLVRTIHRVRNDFGRDPDCVAISLGEARLLAADLARMNCKMVRNGQSADGLVEREWLAAMTSAAFRFHGVPVKLLQIVA